MICKNCGKEISNDSKYCKYCGSLIEENKEISLNKSQLIRGDLKDKKDNEEITQQTVQNDITQNEVKEAYKSNSNDISKEEIKLTKKNNLNIVLLVILCLIFFSMLSVFIYKNAKNTAKNTLIIEEDKSAYTEETNTNIAETETDISSDSYFDVNIDDFMDNYNDYIKEIGNEELMITDEKTENNTDKDTENEMAFNLNDNIKFKAVYNPSKDYRLSSIELIANDKESNDIKDVIKGLSVAINIDISKETSINYAEELISRISEDNKDTINKFFEKYRYEVLKTFNDGLEMYIYKQQINENIDSSYFFDISIEEFIDNYNEYFKIMNIDSIELDVNSIDANDNNDYQNQMIINPSNTNNISIIVSYNPYYDTGIQIIELKADNAKSIIQSELIPVLNGIVYSINKNTNESQALKYAEDLQSRVERIVDERSGYINKFFGDYNYYISCNDNIDIHMIVNKQEKLEYTSSEYSFGIKLDDFIKDYNEYVGKENAEIFEIKDENKKTNDDDDQENITIFSVTDNIKVQANYNPSDNEIKLMKFNIQKINTLPVPKEEVDKVIKGIFYAINNEDSEEVTAYADNIISRIWNQNTSYIDKFLGKYRYMGGYIFGNDNFEMSISKEEKSKNEFIITGDSFKISIDDFVKDYNDYINKADYKILEINQANGNNNDNNDNENIIEFPIDDNLSIKVFYTPIDNNFIKRIEYNYKDLSSELNHNVEMSIKGIMSALNKDTSIEETIEDADDLIERILKNETIDIDKKYGKYNYRAFNQGSGLYMHILGV